MKYEMRADLCRICLNKSKKLRSLYKAIDEGDEPPNEMLVKITGIEIEKLDRHTMLPKNICKNCEMSLSMAFEFREKALESHETILSYLRDLNIPFEKEAPASITSPPRLAVKEELGHIMNNQQGNDALADKIATEVAVEILNNTDPNDADSHTIDLRLDELIMPVKGEELSQEALEFSEENIADASLDPSYEEVEVNEVEDICEETNIDQQQYDEEMEKICVIEDIQEEEEVHDEEEDDDDDDNDNEVQYNGDDDEVHAELSNSMENKRSTKSWSNLAEEGDKIEIDLEYDNEIEPKATARRNRRPKDHENLLGYICDICGNIYAKRGRMMEHRQRHDKELKYSCELCDMKFHMRELLRKHMYSHSGGKPLKCQYCSRSFYYESVRKAHEAVHKGLKPFICDVCGKAFSYGHSLKKHKLIHAEVKLYRCEYCKKDFRLQHHMKQHELTKSHQKAVQLAGGLVDSNASNMDVNPDEDQELTDDVMVEEDEDIPE